MATSETQKLSRLARHSQEEFLSHGSLLNQTRLNRFILIAFFLHASVIILQPLILAKSKDPPAPPPIKVKYVNIQETESINQKKTIIKPSKQKTAEKQKIKPSKQKKYLRKKPVAPRTIEKQNIISLAKAQLEFKKTGVQSKKKRNKKNNSFTPSNKGDIVPEAAKQTTPSILSEKSGPRGTLSLLNGFDLGKYARQDSKTLTQEGSDDEKPISLNTTQAKYISYFDRIKHQIQRVWMYPVQANQKGMGGKLTLKFQISRDGNLLDVHLVNNSGFEILDIAAIKAVKEAAPYYPFPVTILKKKLSILATFVYKHKDNQLNTQ